MFLVNKSKYVWKQVNELTFNLNTESSSHFCGCVIVNRHWSLCVGVWGERRAGTAPASAVWKELQKCIIENMFLFIYKIQKKKRDLKVIQGHKHNPSMNYTGVWRELVLEHSSFNFSAAKTELQQSAQLGSSDWIIRINKYVNSSRKLVESELRMLSWQPSTLTPRNLILPV